ncbi:MAG: sulfur carrier protein ThiS [Hyphomicrobiaceae bacterium]|nr:sulfur carrier protein ThiS [Hyphomicrobiaceae bacterium]
MTQIDTTAAATGSQPSEIATTAKPLELVVNGERTTGAFATLADLLTEFGYGETRVATAVNGEFVAAPARATRQLTSGDRIEIVSPRQGG